MNRMELLEARRSKVIDRGDDDTRKMSFAVASAIDNKIR